MIVYWRPIKIDATIVFAQSERKHGALLHFVSDGGSIPCSTLKIVTQH